MPKRPSIITLIFLFCFSSFGLFAQKKLSSKEAREDLDLLYKRMVQIHPGIHRYQDPDSYRQTYLEIKESLTDSIEYLAYFNRISPLIYEIKDLHTSYIHSKAWQKKYPNRLPFIMKEVEGKNLIQYNVSSDTTFIKGLELLAIDDQSIEDIKRYLHTNIGTDNNNQKAKKLYSSRMLYAYYPKYYRLGDSVKILAHNIHTDSIISFHLKTISNKEFSTHLALKYPSKVRRNLSYSVVDSSLALAKIDVSSFFMRGSILDIFQKKFVMKIKKDFRMVRNDSIQNLVLDFRGNGGGFIPNVSRLLKHVANKPYKLIDTMAVKRSAYYRVFPPIRILPPLVAPFIFGKRDSLYRYRANRRPPRRKPQKNAYQGNLFVFMDGGSYSATSFTICLLKDMERATLLGSVPGGANWGSHAGSWYIVRLPNSRIRIRIPEYKIVHSRPINAHSEFFVEPDVEVDYSLRDFDKNEDSYEKALLKLLRNK